MDQTSDARLSERVERLKREYRLWKCGGGVALMVALILIVGGALRADPPKVVEAEGFVVRDKDGVERMRLGFAGDEQTPVLRLRGQDGGDRVVLQAKAKDNGGLFALDGSGRGEEGLSVVLDGENRAGNYPSLTLLQGQKRRINLTFARGSGAPWLKFTDESGTMFQAPEPTIKQLVGP